MITARANEVEPLGYMSYLFERLPAATSVEQIEALLPWNPKAILEEHKNSLASALA